MLANGQSAQATLDALLASDVGRESRQVSIVDSHGRVAVHTGAECHEWAGHVIGEGFACQGNILTGEHVVQAMAAAYKHASGELSDRLLAALIAGDKAGGDKRGKQAAGLLVVKPNGSYGGDTDRYVDLRVDDAADPVTKLAELVEMHHLFFGTPKPEDLLPITPEIATELQTYLVRGGYMEGEPTHTWDTLAQNAFWALVGNENLEERWSLDHSPDKIDRVALAHLRRRFKRE
jgi:uncharacterized Ntn-hydrolase superfamily protein